VNGGFPLSIVSLFTSLLLSSSKNILRSLDTILKPQMKTPKQSKATTSTMSSATSCTAVTPAHSFLFNPLHCFLFQQLVPIKTDDIKQQPFVTVSGAALNCNAIEHTFDINANQYTSFYKDNSMFPVHADFNRNKYRRRFPDPSANAFVCIDAFLTNVIFNNFGHPTSFQVVIDRINFLGKVGPSGSNVPSSNSIFYSFN